MHIDSSYLKQSLREAINRLLCYSRGVDYSPHRLASLLKTSSDALAAHQVQSDFERVKMALSRQGLIRKLKRYNVKIPS